MGMNYYLVPNCCVHCGRGDAPIHIGKSSAGWCFSLHVTDEYESLEYWILQFNSEGAKIVDEQGGIFTPNEMIRKITERRRPGGNDGTFPVPFGYESWEEFFEQNNAELGPNGLVRSRIGGSCIGHGAGTWDLITGDFS